MTTARLATIALPDFGMPDADARDPRVDLRRADGAPPGAAGEHGYDRLVVYADREHSANLAYLTGFDPRFEEAMLVVGPDRRAGRSWSATSATAWPERRRCRCGATCSRTSACRASRAIGRGRSAEILAAEGIVAGRRGSASSAGRRTRSASQSTRRRSSSTSCGG